MFAKSKFLFCTSLKQKKQILKQNRVIESINNKKIDQSTTNIKINSINFINEALMGKITRSILAMAVIPSIYYIYTIIRYPLLHSKRKNSFRFWINSINLSNTFFIGLSIGLLKRIDNKILIFGIGFSALFQTVNYLANTNNKNNDIKLLTAFLLSSLSFFTFEFMNKNNLPINYFDQRTKQLFIIFTASIFIVYLNVMEAEELSKRGEKLNSAIYKANTVKLNEDTLITNKIL